MSNLIVYPTFFLLFILSVTLTLLVNSLSVISLIFFMAIFALCWKYPMRWSGGIEGISVFSFYTILSILIYMWQFSVLPDYFGFSGGIGIGSDDSYFYSLAVPDLPIDFPVRENYELRLHNYSEILKVFANSFYYIYGSIHPIDLILFNVLCFSFIPFFCKKISFLMTSDLRSASFTFWASLFCPFLIANSLILVRDGWIALFYVASLYSLMVKKYFLLVVMLSGVLFLRFEAGLLLAFSLSVFIFFVDIHYIHKSAAFEYRWKKMTTSSTVVYFLITVLVMIIIVNNPSKIIASILSQLYRVDFLESFIAFSGNGQGTFYKINQLPWFLSVPLGFVFYFGSPFFTTSNILFDGHLIPRAVLNNLFAFLFVFYLAYFSRAIIRLYKSGNPGIIMLMVIFLFDMLVLSQASMQIRHKISLMPYFYILVGYGYSFKKIYSLLLGFWPSVILLFITVFVVFI